MRATIRSMSAKPDFKAYLTQQFGFLERSAAAFDAGHREEAIRIGVALRVIFHDTPSSTSLLKHLDSEHVLIRSQAPDRAELEALLEPLLAGRRPMFEFSWSLANFSGCGFEPCTDLGRPHRLIEAPHWWTEPFAHINAVDYTRKRVVLWAANRDGGAHVDHRQAPDYEQLKAAGALGTIYSGDGSAVPVEDAHLTFLRTMAFEVLNSPDLRALAR